MSKWGDMCGWRQHLQLPVPSRVDRWALGLKGAEWQTLGGHAQSACLDWCISVPQANSAQRMWMSVSCSPTLATMGAPALTHWVATAVCASMAGLVRAVVRTSMTVLRLYASMGPPAMTAWPPFTVPAPWARLVSSCFPCRQQGSH